MYYSNTVSASGVSRSAFRGLKLLFAFTTAAAASSFPLPVLLALLPSLCRLFVISFYIFFFLRCSTFRRFSSLSLWCFRMVRADFVRFSFSVWLCVVYIYPFCGVVDVNDKCHSGSEVVKQDQE